MISSIGQTGTTGYNQIRSTQSNPQSDAPKPSTADASDTASPVKAKQVDATSRTDVTSVGPDLTHVTPNQTTKLAAELFEAGTIDINQMTRMFVIAANQLFPPQPGGFSGEVTLNHEPFNLLEKVEQYQAERPLQEQQKPLLEILMGLQNALEVENHQSINVQV